MDTACVVRRSLHVGPCGRAPVPESKLERRSSVAKDETALRREWRVAARRVPDEGQPESVPPYGAYCPLSAFQSHAESALTLDRA